MVLHPIHEVWYLIDDEPSGSEAAFSICIGFLQSERIRYFNPKGPLDSIVQSNSSGKRRFEESDSPDCAIFSVRIQ